MALNSNALITVETYTDATGWPTPASGSSKLAQVESLINMASQEFETACNRTFLSGSLGVDEFTGFGYNESLDLIHNTYSPENGPIVGTPTLEYEYTSTWNTVTSNWNVSNDNSYIYFTNGKYFYKDYLYKLTYKYGYDGVANIPADIQSAIVILALYIHRSIENVGLSSEADENVQRSFSPKYPEAVSRVIKKYTK